MNTINITKNNFSDIKLAAIPFNTLADHYSEHLAHKQLALEHESYKMGEAHFHKMFEHQLKAGEVADNTATKPLITTLLPKMIAHINNWFEEVKAKHSKHPTAFQFLQEIKPEAIAYITIKTTLACLTSADNTTIQAVASTISQAIEDKAHFSHIHDLEAKHFKKNIEEQLNKHIGHIYKKAFMQVVKADMLSKGLLSGKAWSSWHKEDSIHVGVHCIKMLIESTRMVSLHHQNAGIVGQDSETIKLTPEYTEAITTHAGALAGISPMFQPCIVPPKPWTGITGGGYWANSHHPLALVHTHSKKALIHYKDIYMPEVYKAINIAQNTTWKINKKVLAVANIITKWKHCPVKDIPAIEHEELPMKPEDINMNPEALTTWKHAATAVYHKDKARKSRHISLEFMLEQANKFANHKAIWFPYNMDWHSHVYTVSMFNPQGNNMTKGLLTLAKGKPISKEGYYWLKIHSANCAGVNKVPFPEHIKFIEENHKNIMACTKSPLENTWWAEQDSPFCFLAFCFEYTGVQHHSLSYNCSLPLAFDRSCSGIQHFSTMLQDEVGGRTVNLLPSETIQDIYRIVAKKVNKILQADTINGTNNKVVTMTNENTGEISEKVKLGTKALAGQWLAYSVTHSVTKHSVMTLAYRSKEFSFHQQVLEDTIQPAIDSSKGLMFTQPNQAAGYMAKLIWESVSMTVVAAVEAMNWLKSAAKLLAAEVKDKKTGEILRKHCTVHWVTPDGFPVWQEYKKPIQTRLNLMFLSQFHLQPTINTNKDSKIDAHKQESGITPNFVHSQDSSHLHKTVVWAHKKYRIKSFALIHNSFSTIPADTANLFKAVHETMVDTYESCDVLADFYNQFTDQLHKSQLDKMPALPAKGNLNLHDILESDFTFT